MIGVYDSGVGGLSVWKELKRVMPQQDYVYVADSAYCPYGERPLGEIVRRADAITGFLIEQGVDAVVVACNTATAAAISYLRSTFAGLPFVGMEPAVKPAALKSRTRVVGVLATANTFMGRLYRDTVMKYAGDVTIVEQVGYGLVEAVERGETPKDLVRKYVEEMLEKGADVIVLGCTHFPFLEEEIRAVAGKDVLILNPAPAVARQAARVVGEGTAQVQTVKEGKTRFYSTSVSPALKSIAMAIDPSLTPADFAEVKIENRITNK